MKFDIVKFIDDICQDYLKGERTKAGALSEIKAVLYDNSWQNWCDGKEVVNGVVEANDQAWLMHSDWCIEDKTEDETNETYTD